MFMQTITVGMTVRRKQGIVADLFKKVRLGLFNADSNIEGNSETTLTKQGVKFFRGKRLITEGK
jgi:hypothetical protein